MEYMHSSKNSSTNIVTEIEFQKQPLFHVPMDVNKCDKSMVKSMLIYKPI